MKRILMVLTNHDQIGTTGVANGAYLPELVHPYNAFTAQGYEVDFASPKGGAVTLYGGKADDEELNGFRQNEAVLRRVHASLKPREVDPSRYDAIFYVGGHATMWDFPNNLELASLTASLFERGAVVSAVCHGPAGLVNVRLSDGEYLVKGKRVATFTNDEERDQKLENAVPFLLEDRFRERGATVVTAPNYAANVQTDGRLITGQNPASARGVAEAVVRLLEGEAVAAD